MHMTVNEAREAGYVIVHYYKRHESCRIKSNGCLSCCVDKSHVSLEIPAGIRGQTYLVSFGRILDNTNRAVFYLSGESSFRNDTRYEYIAFAILDLDLEEMKKGLGAFIGDESEKPEDERIFNRLKVHSSGNPILDDIAWTATPNCFRRLYAITSIDLIVTTCEAFGNRFEGYSDFLDIIKNKSSASCASLVHHLLVSGGINKKLKCNTNCYHSMVRIYFCAANFIAVFIYLPLFAGISMYLSVVQPELFPSVGFNVCFAIGFLLPFTCIPQILCSLICNLFACAYTKLNIIPQPAGVAALARIAGQPLIVDARPAVIHAAFAPKASLFSRTEGGYHALTENEFLPTP